MNTRYCRDGRLLQFIEDHTPVMKELLRDGHAECGNCKFFDGLYCNLKNMNDAAPCVVEYGWCPDHRLKRWD